MPRDEAEFLKVPGVGKTKCERYAGDFLTAINQYREQRQEAE